MFNNFFANLVVYDIMWKDFVQPDRPQMMYMCISCWIPKAKRHTLRVYYIGFFTTTMVARTRLIDTFTYIAGLARTYTDICMMNMFMVRDSITPRIGPGRSRTGIPTGV
jgi:hypothetical protein